MKHLSNHEGKIPSSLNSPLGSAACNKQEPSTGEGFTFPASVQSDLFAYLKPNQQEALKPYLRIVKRPYQQKLCISLLDYLEGHGLETFSEPILAMLQEEIVQVCNLKPITTREPKSIGTIIKQLFA